MLLIASFEWLLTSFEGALFRKSGAGGVYEVWRKEGSDEVGGYGGVDTKLLFRVLFGGTTELIIGRKAF